MAKKYQLRYDINFNVDSKKIKSLQTQLKELQKLTVGDIMANTGQSFAKAEASLKTVKNRALEIEDALKKAFNPKLNTINVDKFKQSLNLSGKSLQSLRQEFAKIGPKGQLAFSKIQKQAYSFSTTVRQSHNTLQKLGTTLANSIKWSISSSVINSFSNSIQQAWGFAKSLDGSLNDIRIVTGKSAEEMERFADQANKAAKSFGRTTTDYTKAALIYAQQGLSDKDIAARTDVTMKVANVTGQSADQVSQELTAVWNAYKVSAEEAELYIDRLTAVAAHSASNLQELSTGMGKVAAAAQSLGVTEEQLTAQLSTIISVTRQAPETVGTALKTVYARITDIKAGVDEDGTTLGQYSSKLADMGINVIDTAGNLRNMGTVIEEVGAKWGTFSKEQQIYIAQTMAGQRQYSNLIALFENFDKYNDAMKVAGDSAGTLQQQQNIYMDSLQAHLNQLTTSMQGMWKSLIDSESMKKLTDFLSSLVTGIGNVFDTMGGGGNVLLSIGAIAATVFRKQMAQSLQKTMFNFSLARAEAAQYKSTMNDINASIQQVDATTQEYSKDLNTLRNEQESLQTKQDNGEILTPNQQAKMQQNEADMVDLQYKQEANQIQKEYLERQKQILVIQRQGSGIYTREEIKALQEKNEKLKETQQLQLAAQEARASAIRNFSDITNENGKNYLPEGQTADNAYLDSLGTEGSDSFADNIKNALAAQKEAYKEVSAALRENINTELGEASNPINEIQSNFAQKSQELGKAKAQLQQWEQLVSAYADEPQYQNEASEQVSKWKTNVAALEEQINKLNAKKLELTDETQQAKMEKLQKLAIKINTALRAPGKKSLINQEDLNTAKALSEKIKEIKQKLSEGQSVSNEDITKLKEDMQQLQKAFGNAATAVDGYEQQLKQLPEATAHVTEASEKTKQLKQDFKNTTQAMSFSALADQATRLVTGITQIIAISTQLSNLGSIWGNDSLTVGQKLLKSLPSIAMAFSTIVMQTRNVIGVFKAKKAVTEADTTATNANTGATRTNTGAIRAQHVAQKTATISAKSFVAALGPVIAIASIAIGVISTLIGFVSSLREEQKKSYEEKLQSSLQAQKETLNELKKTKQLISSLEELTEQYQQGTISRSDLKLKILELTKNYDIESSKVKQLISNYTNLEQALERLKEQNNQQMLFNTKNRLDTANQLVKSKLGYSSTEEGLFGYKSNKFSYDFYRGNFTSQEQQILQRQAGFSDYLGRFGTDFGAAEDASNPYAVAQTSLQLKQGLEALQAQPNGRNSKGYQELASQWNKAQQAGIQDVIDAYLQEQQETAIAALRGTQVTKIDSVKDYKTVIEQAITNFQKKNPQLAQSLTEEEINEIISTQIMNINLDAFSKYANQADIARKYSNTVSGHEEELQQFSNISLEDLAYLDEKDVETWDELRTILEAIENDAKTSGSLASVLGVEEIAQMYQKYEDVLNKVSKGQKLTKQEYQSLDAELQKFFVQSANGQWKMVEDLGDFKNTAQQILLTKYNQNIDEENKIIETAQKKQKISYDSNLTGYKQGSNAQTKDEFLSGFKDNFTERLSNEHVTAYRIGPQNYIFKNDSLARAWNIFKNQYKDYLDPKKDANEYEILNSIDKAFDPSKSDQYKKAMKSLIEKVAERQQESNLDTNQLINMMAILEDSGVKTFSDSQKSTIQKGDKTDDEYIRIAREIQTAYNGLEPSDFDYWKNADKIKQAQQNKKITDRNMYQTLFGTDSDLKDTDIYNLNNTIKETAANSTKLSWNLTQNADAAQDLAKEILRFDNSIQDVIKNVSSWQEALSNGALVSAQDIRDAYADMFNIQDQVLSINFIENQNNIKLLQEAALGNKQAYIKLQNLIQEDLIDSVKKSLQEPEKFDEALNDLQDKIKNLKIGDTIENQYIQALLNMLNQTGATVKQMEAIFKGLQIDVHLVEHEGEGVVIQTGTTATLGADYETKWANISSSSKDSAEKQKKQREAQVDLKDLAKDQRDFYHDINIELDKINTKLSKAEKIQKRLYGKELIDNLNKQQDILNQEIAALKQKQAIQQQDLKYKASQLSSLGVTFNSDGTISNYMQVMTQAQNALDAATNHYNALANAYNGSTDINYKEQLKEQMDEANKDMSRKSTDLNNLKSSISDYDNLQKGYEEIVDKVDDAVQKIIEINIQKFRLEASLSLDLGEAKRQWNDFKRNVLEHDSIILTTSFQKVRKDAQQNLSNAASYFTSSELAASSKQLSRIVQAVNNINTNGTDEIYGDNKAKALEDGKTAQQQLMDGLQNLAQTLDAIDQAYLDTIDNIHEMYSKQQEAYQKNKEQLSHNLDLLQLLYGDKNYAAMNKYYTKIQQNNVKELDFLRKIEQENYARWKEAEARAEQAAKENGEDSEIAKQLAADAQKFKEAYLQNVADINSVISEGIQNLQSQYNNAINQIFDEMEQKLTNNKGFTYLDTQWELMKKKADLYLDTVNSAFAIKNVKFAFEKALNDTQGLKNQQQLKKVMNEQLQILKQKDKLTQYDVDRASKLLDIEKARIALEEAKSNKATMRLKRDSQGNYSYQFTADQTAIDEAENKLAQTENDLYNFDKNQYEKNLKEAYDATKGYLEKRKALELEYLTATPERQAQINDELKLLAKDYNDYIQSVSKQTAITQENLLQSAMLNYADLYSLNQKNFATMSDNEKRKWLEDMIPSLRTGIATLIQKFSTGEESLEKIVVNATKQMDLERQKYQAGLEQLEKSSSRNFEAIQKGEDEVSVKMKELVHDNDDLLDRMEKEYDAIQELRDQGDKLKKTYQEVTTQAALAVGQFEKMWTEEQTKAINAAASAVYGVANAYTAATSAMEAFARTATSGGTVPTGTGVASTGAEDMPTIKGIFSSLKKKTPLDNFMSKVNLNNVNDYMSVFGIGGNSLEDTLNKLLDIANQDRETAERYKSIIDFLREANKAIDKEIPEKDRQSYKNPSGMYTYAAFKRVFPGFSEDDYKKWYSTNWNFIESRLEMPFKTGIALLKNIEGIKELFPDYFDTGGYTGAWNSKQGKLAVLHEKELILNKDDTENMLKMLEVSREYSSLLSSLVQNNVLNELNRITTQLNAPELEWKKEYNRYSQEMKRAVSQLDQQVKIEASFPAVNSKQEIEDALSNLVNLAAQRALKINKN